jgi:outer membrane protein
MKSNKYNVIILTIGLLLASVSSYAQEETLKVSLEEAENYALQHNYSLKNAKLDIDIANAQVREVRSMGLPQINGSAGFTHNLEIATQVLPDFITPSVYGVLFQEGVIPPKDVNVNTLPAQFGVPFTFNAFVGVNQLLFDGTFFLGLKAAEEFVNVSKLLASQSEIEVKEGVRKAYYMALISDRNIGQLEESLENIQKLKQETQAMYDAGLAEKLDVDRLVLSASNIEVSINNLKQQAKLAKQVLLNSMGLDVNKPLILTSQLPEFTPENFAVDYGLGTNVDNRIELQLLNQQQELNELDLKRWKVGYVPSLYGNFNYGQQAFASDGNFSELGSEWFPVSSYGFSLNVPVFDGLMKKSKMDQVRVEIAKTENTIAQLTNGINLEVSQARTEYESAFKNIELQKKSLELAETIYNTTQIKFKEGVGSSFEMITAESDLTQARTNYLNALYQLSISKVSLDKALGKL